MEQNGVTDLRSDGTHPADIPFLRERIRAAGMPEAAQAALEHELTRFEQVPPTSTEYSLIRSYFDWLLTLPWNQRTEDQTDIGETRAKLDEGHFGLELAKDRITEHLSVMKLRGDDLGPVLCLVGPPGTGKTSLCHSVARVLGRKIVRISLRGLADETEICGQRRTRLDALPGRIIRGIRTAGSSNPVFVLEEIDRLGPGGTGDIQAALAEVLDPKLRATFTDHYLDVPFDLSGALFVVTAHLFEAIPEALAGSLDPILLPGYVQEEKYEIARHHLLPRERWKCGLDEQQFDLDDWALQQLLRSTATDAGVGRLKEQIGRLARKAAGTIASHSRTAVKIGPGSLPEWIGAPLEEKKAIVPDVGVAQALVITPGGAKVSSIEVSRISGRHAVTITGPQSTHLRELVQVALSILRARAKRFDFDPETIDQTHLHIHVQDVLAPSDLASLGLGIFAALVSAFTGKPIRGDLALTGAVSLKGRLRAVPGIVDKVLAARRLELTDMIVPKDNAGDLEQVPDYVYEAIKIHTAETVDEALAQALLQIIVPKPEETSAIEKAQQDAPDVTPNSSEG
jgi:ATP-dependent Lon protease